MRWVHNFLCIALWLVPIGASAQLLDLSQQVVSAPNVTRTLPLAPDVSLRMQSVDRYPDPLLGVGRFEPDHEFRTTLESKLGELQSGVVEFRWSEDGQKTPAIAGVPVAMKFRHGTVVVGVNLRH